MKTNKFKRLIISVISIVMIFSTMTSCGQDVNSDNSSTAASVADDNSSEKDTIAIDINVSRENGESSGSTDSNEDSSENDSMATSTTKTSDSSETGDSSKTESTTKKTNDSSGGGTTSTKATADVTGTTNNTNTTKITSNTTSKTISQSTTKSTTKSTTTTTKQTTKQTTSTSISIVSGDHSDPSSYIKPTGLTRIESAVWDASFPNTLTNKKYNDIIREELIKYGQEFCKQRNAPKYQVNSKMYPYYDKNGKPLYTSDDMYGNTIAVGSNVEFPYDEHWTIYGYYKSAQDRLESVRGFIERMYLLTERVICNSFRHGIEDMQWNITYGLESTGMAWTVMTGFPDDWK